MKKVFPAPDGGWGWLVVVGRFVMQIMFAGLERGYGVLYVVFLDRYSSSASVTTWLGSFQSAVRLLGGIGVSMLVNGFGERRVAIAGGFLYSLGFILSMFIPNIGLLFLTYGLLGGAGASLAYTPPYVLMSKYFDKRIGLANSVAALGSGVGILSLPVLMNYLLKVYGYTGCMLSLGGFALHLVVSGALYSPVIITQKITELENTNKETWVELQPVTLNTEQLLLEDNESSVEVGSESNKSESIMKLKPAVSRDKLGESLGSLHSGSEEIRPNIGRPRLNSIYSMKSVGDDALIIVDDTQDIEDTEEARSNKTPRKLFDSELFRDIGFVQFSIASLFSTLCLSPVGSFLPASAKDVGVPIDKGVFLISAIGASDFACRFIIGTFIDKKKVKPYRGLIWGVSMIGMGLACFAMAAAKSLWSYMLASILFGANSGVTIAQRATILRDIVGAERMGNAFGISIFCQGIGFLSAAPVAGALKDATQSYIWSFVFLGTCGVIGGVLFSASQLFRIRKNQSMQI